MAYCTNLRYHNYKMLLHYPGHTFKWTISYLLLIIFVFSAAEGILTDISRNEVTNPYLYIPQMLSLTSVIISLVYYHHMEYWDRPHLVWLLLLYWIMGIIGEVLAIFRVTDSLGFSSTIIRFDIGIIVIILYTCCAAAEINIVRKKIFSKPSHSRTIPRDFQKRNLYFIQSYTNSISSLTIWWLSWLVSLARRQTLELQNLGCLPETYEGKHILRMFKKAYRLEKDSHFVTVKEFFSNGFILVLVAGMSLALRTIAWSSSYGISADIGIKLRTSIQNMVYEKTLRLSTASTNDSSAGQTINHMSIDGSAVLWFFLFINCIISNPIQAIAVCIWLFCSMGIAGVFGVLVVILALPIIMRLGAMQRQSQMISLSYSDSRMRKTNELLQGIKFLKLSGWEELFASGITRVRNEEMKHKLTVGYYFLLSTIISQSLPFIVPFVIFAVYSQLYTAPLTPDVVFSVLAVANLLYQPLYLIPTSAKYIVEGLSSTKRLHHFLSLDEMSKYTDQELCNNAEEDDIDDALVNYELQKHSTKDTTPLLHNKINNTHLVSDLNKLKQFSEVVEIEKRKGASVEINNGYFRWESDSADTVLKDISVRFHAGTLTMIVGKVGSGKSSLLFAILGEMNTISGTVNYYGKKHKVAYVAQKTWLQYATLRDNIIFGEEFNKERYTTVLEVCALNSDLRMLPDGDLTEIGENGIILSGGQKQRVALARALYSKTEIVIMDDPLSALDAHVGAHVMEKAILGFLREQQRTVILVTHHMQHLEHADQVLVMESGQIIQKGNLSEIRKNSPYLYKQWQQLFSLISESECESGDDSVSRKSRRKLPNTILINTTRNSNGSILAVEGRKRGSAAWPIFLSYAKVMRLPRVCVLIMCFLMEVSGFVMINLWLSAWSQATQESLDNTMVSIGVMFFMVIGVVSLLVSIYGNLKPSHVGLAVTTGASVAQLMSTLLIAMVDFLSHVNGVERVLEYANIVIEKDQGKTMPPAGWPSKGSIILCNISVRYADGLDPILHNVKVRFKAGQKIGICGRTGSGKSSLALALLRIVDIIEGGITIDGIDISTVPLLTLRNRISIIPQDPVLFVGTIR
ncbi:ATP-binding cassette sub-family C member 9-like [Saccoglossus kowalevskii]